MGVPSLCFGLSGGTGVHFEDRVWRVHPLVPPLCIVAGLFAFRHFLHSNVETPYSSVPSHRQQLAEIIKIAFYDNIFKLFH